MATESGIFQVQADLNIAVSDASVNQAAAQIKAKLDAALKPVDIKITAQQSANVNRSLEAMTKNLQNITKEATKVVASFKAIGDAGVDAFRRAGLAKDAFRANLSLLRRDLEATAAQATRTGEALGKAFAAKTGTTSTAGAPTPAAASTSKLAQIAPLTAIPLAINEAAVANLEKSIAVHILHSSVIPTAIGSSIESGLSNFKPTSIGPLFTNLEKTIAQRLKQGVATSGDLALAANPIATGTSAALLKLIAEDEAQFKGLWGRIKNTFKEFNSSESGAISFSPFIDSFKKLGSGIKEAGSAIIGEISSIFKTLFSVFENITPRIVVSNGKIRFALRGTFKAAKEDAAAFTKELKTLSDQFSSGDISAKNFEQRLLSVTGKGKTRAVKGIFEEANLGALQTQGPGTEKDIAARAAAVGELNTQLTATGAAGGEAAAGIGGMGAALIPLIPILVGIGEFKFFKSAASDFVNNLTTPLAQSLKAAQNNFDTTFENLKRNVGQAIAPAFIKVLDQLTPFIKQITPLVIQLAQAFGDALTGVVPIIKGVIGVIIALTQSVNVVLDILTGKWGAAWNLAKQFVAEFGVGALQIIKAVVGGIEWILKPLESLPLVGGKIKDAFSGAQSGVDALQNSVANLGNSGSGAVQQLVNPAIKFIQATVDAASGIEGIQNSIVSAANAALDAAKAVVDQNRAIIDLKFQQSQTQRELNALTTDQGNILREQQNAYIGIQDIIANINALDLQRLDVLFNEQQRLAELIPTQQENERKVQEAILGEAAAKRAVADAQLNYNVLLRESQFSQGVSLNLANLTSQQIKAQLAQARSALAFASTPTFTETQAKNARDLAAAHDQVTGAVLAQSDASKAVLDAQVAQTQFIHDSNDAAVNYQATLDGLNRQEAKAVNDKTEAQFQYGLLLSGQAGIQQQIVQLQHTQADQNIALASAQTKLTEDVLIQKKAEADMRGDRAASLGYEQQILGVKDKQAPLDAAGQIALAASQGSLTTIDGLWSSIQKTLPGVFDPINNLVDPTKSLAGYTTTINNNLTEISKLNFGNLPGSPSGSGGVPKLQDILGSIFQNEGIKNPLQTSLAKSQTIQDEVSNAIKNNPGLLASGVDIHTITDLLTEILVALSAAGPNKGPTHDVLDKLWRATFNTPLPFAEGGVIEGINSNFGRLIRAGEHGRDELMLPLQSGPNKVWQLLAKTLPKYPALQAGVAQLAPAGVSAAALASALPSGRGGTGNADMDRRSNNKELAEAIVDAMEKRGGLKKEIYTGQTTVQVSTPVTDPHALAKHIVSAQERALLRKLP